MCLTPFSDSVSSLLQSLVCIVIHIPLPKKDSGTLVPPRAGWDHPEWEMATSVSLLTAAGFANGKFPSGGTSGVRPFASAPLTPCKLMNASVQARFCPLPGRKCRACSPALRGEVTNYLRCFSSISLRELLSCQGSLERSCWHFLQG